MKDYVLYLAMLTAPAVVTTQAGCGPEARVTYDLLSLEEAVQTIDDHLSMPERSDDILDLDSYGIDPGPHTFDYNGTDISYHVRAVYDDGSNVWDVLIRYGNSLGDLDPALVSQMELDKVLVLDIPSTDNHRYIRRFLDQEIPDR